MNKILQLNNSFAGDVKAGLSAKSKYLSSKYFYNEKGDELFQKIMKLDEYYLTRCEYEILRDKKEIIAEAFESGGSPFNLIELGAGDGYKTKILLHHFCQRRLDFTYIPVDISKNILQTLEADLKSRIPDLKVQPYEGDYFNALKDIHNHESTRNVVLFLGSNIGNFKEIEMLSFLKEISDNLSSADKILIGFDLKKDPQFILNAYNDEKGVTRDFNLNLLKRINEELGGDFDTEAFMHYPLYDPSTGQARSYLISKKEQKVFIDSLHQSFVFKKWEPVMTEVSQKFDLSAIERAAFLSGFKIEANYFDQQRYFVDSLWSLR